MSKSAGLGRGLDELFGEQTAEQSAGPVTMLNIDALEPNRDQPRRYFDEDRLSSLAESIARHGVITPLTVRKIADGRYKIIAGERRYRASRRAGLTEVPVIILDADELHATELALVENLQRADLNPMEEAEGYRSLIDRFDLRQEDVAERVGRSRSAVANALRLLDLPEAIAEHVVDGDLSDRIKVNSNDLSPYYEGTYPVTFEVTNSLGDTASLTMDVVVRNYAAGEPRITLTQYLVYRKAGERFDARAYLDSVSGGAVEDVAIQMPEGGLSAGVSQVT